MFKKGCGESPPRRPRWRRERGCTASAPILNSPRDDLRKKIQRHKPAMELGKERAQNKIRERCSSAECDARASKAHGSGASALSCAKIATASAKSGAGKRQDAIERLCRFEAAVFSLGGHRLQWIFDGPTTYRSVRILVSRGVRRYLRIFG